MTAAIRRQDLPSIVWCVVLVCLTDAPARAQPPDAASPASSVSVFGSIRSRAYLWNWFGDDPAGDYSYAGTLLRGGVSRKAPSWDWQIEFALPVLLNLPTDAALPAPQGQLGLGATYFAANGNSSNPLALFPKQVFVRFKDVAGVRGQEITVGRMEFNDGGEVAPKDATLAALKRDRISQRLVGTFGFSDVGRSIDGVQYAYAGKDTNLTSIVGRPTQGVFQVNGWGELDIVLAYGAVTRQTGGERAPGEFRVFGLWYDDGRHDIVKIDNRPTALRSADTDAISIGTFGGDYLQMLPTAAGPIDLLAWAAGQIGSWGTLAQQATAFSIEAGWQPSAPSALRLWLRGGYDYASGDGDAADTVHGTFFQVLPTPRIYARLPFYNMMNSKDAFGELIARPTPHVTVRADVHAIDLADAHDLWYSGGGAYQPETFGYTGRPSNGNDQLATLSDVSVDLAVNARVAVNGYFGDARGAAVTQAIYAGDRSARFGYLEIVVRWP